ncbi:hypothetical protein ACHAXR_007779 [Thalassiosira sp. AJA248-18]
MIASLAHNEPKLADGCYHVLLDVGSNIGIHARFLLEPSLYPKAQIARNFFRSHFGPEEQRDNRDFCIFAFEPNPSHVQRHKEMKRVYDIMGWRYYPIHGGVSDEDGNLTFYHIGDEYGFTTLKSSCRKRCDPEHVPVYRLSSWIKREIHGRKLPQLLHGTGYSNGPRVVMKMDVEMMEWILFPDLLMSGVLCEDINAMMGEFHLKANWFFYPITFEGHGKHGASNLTIQTWEEADKLKNEWLTMMERNPHCKTVLSMKDDETYRLDGMPFPTEGYEAQLHNSTDSR